MEDHKVLLNSVYSVIDLSKYASIDGENSEVIVRPYENNPNMRVVSVGLVGGFSRDRYEFLFKDGAAFDHNVLPQLLKYYLNDDSVAYWQNSGPVDIPSATVKVLAHTESGNDFLLQTNDSNLIYHLVDLTEESKEIDKDNEEKNTQLKKAEFTNEEKICERVINYLNKRKETAYIMAVFNEEQLGEIIKLVSAMNKSNIDKSKEELSRFIESQINDTNKEVCENLIADISLPNPVLLKKIERFIENEKKHAKYMADNTFVRFVSVGKELSQNGYFQIRSLFPRNVSSKDLASDAFYRELLDSNTTTRYQFLENQKENYLSVGKTEEAKITEIFQSWLTKKKYNSLLLKERKETSTSLESDIKIDVEIEDISNKGLSGSFEDVKNAFLLCDGAKIENESTKETVEVVVKRSEDGKRTVSIALVNGLSRDRFDFSFGDGVNFDNEILPKIIDLVTAKDNVKENISKNTKNGNLQLIKTNQGNELLFYGYGLKKDDQGLSNQKISLSKEDRELAEYFRKDILRRQGVLPPVGLQEIDNLAKVNERVNALEEARRRLTSGTLSQKEYDIIHDTYRAQLAAAIKNSGGTLEEPFNEINPNTANPSMDNPILVDSEIENNNKELSNKKLVLSKEDQELAEYFRKDILRRQGGLPPVGLQEIDNLAKVNERVNALEEASRRLSDGRLSKEEYDKIHDTYRAQLVNEITGNSKSGEFDSFSNNKFNNLYKLVKNYSVQNVDGVLKIFNRSSKNEYFPSTQKEKDNIEFASYWTAACGIRSSSNDTVLGETYAFNSDSEKLFNIMDVHFEGSEKRNIEIDKESLKREFKNTKNDKAELIFDRLFKDDNHIKYVKNHYKIQLAEDVEYIPGTNIPKPKDRGITQTDDSYVNYLEDYYGKVFPGDGNSKDDLPDEAVSIDLESDIKEIAEEQNSIEHNEGKIFENADVTPNTGVESEQEKIVKSDNNVVDRDNSSVTNSSSNQENIGIIEKEERNPLDEINTAYEIADSYSNKDKPASLRIFFPNDIPNSAQVIVSYGPTNDEDVLYSELFPREKLVNEMLDDICDIYVKNSGIVSNEIYEVPNTDKAGAITLGKNENLLQISNGSKSEVNKFQFALRKAEKQCSKASFNDEMQR